jgi:hypothetical protein
MPDPASSFMVGNAPSGASYAAPLLNFAPLSQLPQDYFQGQQRARTTRLQNAFPDGLPRNSDGSVDVNSVGDTLTKLGGAEYASQMMPFLIQSQMGSQGAAAIDNATGQQGSPPAQAPTTVPGASGPANIRGPQRTAQPGGTSPVQQSQSPAQPSQPGEISMAGQGSQQNPYRPRSQADFNQIPDGAYWVGPSGPPQLKGQSASPNIVSQNGSAATGAPVGGASGAPAPAAGNAPDGRGAIPGQNGGPADSGMPNAAAGLVPQGYDPNGFANALTQRAAALRSQAARYAAFPNGANQAKVLQEQAQALDDRAKQIYDVIGKAAEPTPEQKNFQVGRQPGETLPQYQARVAGAQKQAEVAAENSALTPEQKNFQVGRQPGETLPQYQARVAGAQKQAEVAAENSALTPEQKNLQPLPGAPAGALARTEEQKAEVVQSQKTYNGIQAASTQYERDLKPYLDLSRSIINDPQFYSGTGANLSLDINRVRARLGDQQAAVLQEALQKVTASSVLGQINTQRDQLMEAGGASSRIFSQQVALVEKAAPALANTPAGNRFLVEVSSRMGNLSSQIAGMARDYIAKNGHLNPQFDQQVAAFMKANPVFSKQEMSHPELIAAPSAPPAATNTQQIVAWGRSMGLKTGDPMRMPDGSIKAMP